MSVVLQNINLRLILRLISTIVINRKSQKMLRKLYDAQNIVAEKIILDKIKKDIEC